MATISNIIPNDIYRELAKQLTKEAEEYKEDFFSTHIEIGNYFFEVDVEVDCDFTSHYDFDEYGRSYYGGESFTYYSFEIADISASYITEDCEETMLDFDYDKFFLALDDKLVDEYYEGVMEKMFEGFDPIQEFDNIMAETFPKSKAVAS